MSILFKSDRRFEVYLAAVLDSLNATVDTVASITQQDVIFGIGTLLLFVKTDLKTISLPTVRGSFAALARNTHDSFQQTAFGLASAPIIYPSMIPATICWSLTCLLVFNISNQIDSVAEDCLNSMLFFVKGMSHLLIPPKNLSGR